jgi:hypothetical protein
VVQLLCLLDTCAVSYTVCSRRSQIKISAQKPEVVTEGFLYSETNQQTNLPTYLPTYLPTHPRTYLPAFPLYTLYLPTLPSTHLPNYLPIHPPTYPHPLIYLPTHPSTYLFTHPSTSLPTYLPSQWSRVPLEKLTGPQLVKEYSAFCETRRIITAFTSSRHLTLCCARSVQISCSFSTAWC